MVEWGWVMNVRDLTMELGGFSLFNCSYFDVWAFFLSSGYATGVFFVDLFFYPCSVLFWREIRHRWQPLLSHLVFSN